MPRRALRKIDPALDYAPWLKLGAELPDVCDLRTLFAAPAPLEVEVGSGKGLFLSSAATANPERNFLGIEMAGKYAHFAAARVARLQLKNACVIQGDALRALAGQQPGDSLAAIHVYFPDPWWKARHKKRRVVNEAFLRDVERTLVPGGLLHFWTDVEEYFQTTLALVATASGLTGPIEVAERPPEHDLDYRTHFERRTRLVGQPVYRAQFRKA